MKGRAPVGRLTHAKKKNSQNGSTSVDLPDGLQQSIILTRLDMRGSPSTPARPRNGEHVVGEGVAENEFRVGET